MPGASPEGSGEQAWAWVRPMYERYVEVEQQSIRNGVAKLREAQASALAAKAGAEERAATMAATAEAHSNMAADQAMDALKRVKRDYPEAVVGGGIVAWNLLNGFGPRRSLFLVGPALAFAVRGSLEDKWGDDVAAASKAASNAARAQCEAMGLLPPKQ